MDKSKLKVYGIFVLVTEAVGTVAGLLTSLGMEKYATVEKPALTPPDIVFPIAWSILYALMAVSAARVYLGEESENKEKGLKLYVIQLGMNFLWSIIFFNFMAYGFAFFWLLLLLAAIILMALVFYKLDRISAYLLVPYILWVTFAGYLNFMVWMLNK